VATSENRRIIPDRQFGAPPFWPPLAFVTVVLRDGFGGVAIVHIVFTPGVTCWSGSVMPFDDR
jgi:hypothetical protein